MKTVSLFFLALFVALLLCGTALCSTPRHPGVTGVGDNPQEGTVTKPQTGAQAIQDLIQNAKGNLAIEKKWEVDPLSRPKFNLIPAVDIGKYRFSDRYLDLGDTEVSHYFILQEDYVFRNLDGRFDKIPAGFVWDGASIPKVWDGTLIFKPKKIIEKLLVSGLEIGNTRYNSGLAEGLIHDYMYRSPQRYTKKEADELFYDNLKKCNNSDAMAMYKGVDLFGDDSYLRHWNNQRQGYYDVFTPEFYAENLKIFRGGKDSSLLKGQADVKNQSRKNPSSDWDCCKCENPEDSDFQCKKCGKMSKWLAPKQDPEFLQFLKKGMEK